MENIKIFENEKFGKIRTVILDGEPWAVLRDICTALGITYVRDVAKRLDSDEVGQTPIIDTMGRKQNMTIVNESGMYNVILRSDKPEAKAFKRWVTHEILPTLRKTGAYALNRDVAPAPAQPTMAIVREMELRFKVMEKMGCTPYEIAGMMTSMDRAYGIAVSKVLADQLDPQLCLFDAPALPSDAPLMLV